MKKEIGLSLIIGFLSGCVSSSDFAASQQQIRDLSAKVQTTERQMQLLQNELAVVKGQRLIRLPTGAPTAVQPRENNAPSNNANADEQAFKSAVSLYRSGDSNGAIGLFEAFYRDYPTSNQRLEALYYLGQANYTIRNYIKAQQALENLIYNNNLNQVNPRAPSLLMRVYKAQGLADKGRALNDFINQNKVSGYDEQNQQNQIGQEIMRPNLSQ